MNGTIALSDHDVTWTGDLGGQMRAKWLSLGEKKVQVFIISVDALSIEDPDKRYKKITVTVEDL